MSGDCGACRYMNPRPCSGKAYIPTSIEHRANIYTHGLFVVPSFIALTLMVHLSHTPVHTCISWIYGLALILLFSFSTAFHVMCYVGNTGKLKRFCHLGDRAIIYVFIAASYTPWMVLKDHDMGDIIWLTWLATILCVLYQLSFHDRFAWLEIIFYLALGICPSIFVTEMPDKDGITEIAVSGAIVISGILFFKADGVIPFAHAIWHCFVSAGAGYHYYAVLKYLYQSNLSFESSNLPITENSAP